MEYQEKLKKDYFRKFMKKYSKKANWFHCGPASNNMFINGHVFKCRKDF